MKLKRILASILAICMVLSTMGFTVLADEASSASVAKIGDTYYATLEEAFKAVTVENNVVEILEDVTVDYLWNCRSGNGAQFTVPVTINGNNKTIKFTDEVKDNNWNTVFRFEADATVKDLTIDISEATLVQRVITAKKSLAVDGLTIIGSAKYGIIFGEGSGAEDLAEAEISIANSTLNGTRRAISDNENGKDVKSVAITDNTLNANVYVSAYEAVTFTGNTVTGGYVDIRSYTANNSLNVTATDNTLEDNTQTKYNYIKAGGTIDAQGGFVIPWDGVTISNLEEFKMFRDAVNAGDSYAGKTVTLTSDIDLAGENWVAIGSATQEHGFMGNFDGQNYKIMNLTITDPALDSDGYAYAGLFGITEGIDKDNQNFIKNLTIENVDITTDGHIVAAAIAYPYYTIVENVTVCGDIAINGGNYTAGILAYTRRCVNASNLTIEGNEGSYITGAQVVGGVISDIQMNGGLIAEYSDFNAEGLTISGDLNVGGISGIIASQTLNTCSVKNVTIDCDDNRQGIVAGSLGGVSTISNVTTDNVTGATAIVGANYEQGAVEAKIGDTYYATLAKAFETAENGDTVTLLTDIEDVVEIPEGVALDTNGYRFGDSLTGKGTEEDPYLINNIDELVWFRNDVNAGNTYEGKYVKLTADIDFDGYTEVNSNYKGESVSSETFRPIADRDSGSAFKGVFDGGNNTISGLYQSGWDINYHWDHYGQGGLFGTVENATIKNLTMSDVEIQIEGGDVAAIAGHAKGDCTFENITVTDSAIATYNNGCAGILAWSEAGDYIFKGIVVDESVTLAGLWGSFDASIGGVLSQADAGATYLFEDVDVSCRLDIYNDVTAAYKYYNYRMCGMLIGRGAKFMDGNEVDLTASNITCKNVNITIGEWANYTYINTSGSTWKRVEPGYTYGGVDVSQYPDAEIIQNPVTSIVGGGQYGYSGTTAEEFAEQGYDEDAIAVEDLAEIARRPAPVEVTTYEELVNALAKENANVIMMNDITGTATKGGYNLAGIVINAGDVLDGNGYKLTINGANGTWDCAVAMTGGTVKNLTVANGFRGIFMPGADGDVVIDNVKFENVIYTFNSDAGSTNYSVTIKNTTLNGWTSYSAVHKSVAFEDCTFGEGSGYAFLRPYQATTFTGCEFNEGFEFDTMQTAANTLEFNDCTYAGEELSADVAGPLFYDGGSLIINGEAVVLDKYVPVAQIGNVKYISLNEAFEAAQDGDTIKLINDVELDTIIANTKNVTLDLNGKTITGIDNTEKNFSLIDNRGDLTITGNGKMTLTATVNSGWNRYSAVIANNPGGKLVIENGTIEHLGGTDMAYGIDNLTNGKGTYAETIINGGTIKSTYRGIRQFLNGVDADNILTVNGGTVEGANKSIWMQDPSKNANSGTITVGENAVVNGDVYLSVTAGSTEWPVEVKIAETAVKGAVLSSNVPAGYEVVNENGFYGIKNSTASGYKITAVASQSKVRYNNGNPDSFTVKYVATGGDVIGAMAQLEYDTNLFICDEDPNATGRIRMNSNSLTTDANGETLLKELHFTVKENVEVDTTYTFIAKYVQVVSNYDDAGAGTQDGFVENVIGANVTIIAQYDVTLDTEGAIAGNTYVDKNTDYTGNINDFNENKIYTITYTMGGEEYSIEVEDETFVIENVTGDIVFTGVESELDFELILVADAVSEYTLVLVKDGVSAGYTYNGEEMFAVERYVGLTEVADESVFEAEEGVSIKNATSVRAILIRGAVTLDEARNAIAASANTSDNLDISYDVNRNGAFYFNDAMTAHGCYKDQYTLYANMAKLNWYLSSDVNTDFVVDTDDYDDTVEAFWNTLD